MTNNPGIYRITSPTQRVYIGQTWNLHARIRSYRAMHCKTQKVLYRSLSKHKVESHKIEVLAELPFDTTQDILDNFEILYISQHKECGFKMMNIKEGGSRGKHGEITKLKFIGNRNGEGNKGKIRNVENRLKISNSLKNLLSNKGELHNCAKLTNEIILSIRSDYIPKKFGCRKIAKKYDISKTHARDIISRKVWRNI